MAGLAVAIRSHRQTRSNTSADPLLEVGIFVLAGKADAGVSGVPNFASYVPLHTAAAAVKRFTALA